MKIIHCFRVESHAWYKSASALSTFLINKFHLKKKKKKTKRNQQEMPNQGYVFSLTTFCNYPPIHRSFGDEKIAIVRRVFRSEFFVRSHFQKFLIFSRRESARQTERERVFGFAGEIRVRRNPRYGGMNRALKTARGAAMNGRERKFMRGTVRVPSVRGEGGYYSWRSRRES